MIHTYTPADLRVEVPPGLQAAEVSASSSLKGHPAGRRVEGPAGQGLVLLAAPALWGLCPSQDVSGALQGARCQVPGLLRGGASWFSKAGLQSSAPGVLCATLFFSLGAH